MSLSLRFPDLWPDRDRHCKGTWARHGSLTPCSMARDSCLRAVRKTRLYLGLNFIAMQNGRGLFGCDPSRPLCPLSVAFCRMGAFAGERLQHRLPLPRLWPLWLWPVFALSHGRADGRRGGPVWRWALCRPRRRSRLTVAHAVGARALYSGGGEVGNSVLMHRGVCKCWLAAAPAGRDRRLPLETFDVVLRQWQLLAAAFSYTVLIPGLAARHGGLVSAGWPDAVPSVPRPSTS